MASNLLGFSGLAPCVTSQIPAEVRLIGSPVGTFGVFLCDLALAAFQIDWNGDVQLLGMKDLEIVHIADGIPWREFGMALLSPPLFEKS